MQAAMLDALRALLPRSRDEPLDVSRVHAEHAGYVWKLLQRFGVRGPDLEDMLQEVFIVVHQRRATYDPQASLQSWLYGIALRVAASYRRRAHRRYEALDEAPHERRDAERPSAEPTPERTIEDRERRAVLDAVLDAMELERRAVLVMFELEGLSCGEIAALTGVPVGTVYSRLHLARRDFEGLARRHLARAGGAL